MALLFLDSFDHYTNAGDKYLAGGSHVVSGRHGNGFNAEVRCALTPASSQVIIGTAWKINSPFQEIYELFDSHAWICSVSTMNDGAIEIEMFGGPSARTAADSVRVGQWHYIELDLTVANTFTNPYYQYSLPVVKIYLDGALVLDTSLGYGVIEAEPGSIYGWSYINIGPNISATFDDLYICDGSGPAPHNAPLGDVQIDVIRPNGAGASTAWTPIPAAPNFACVDDLTPDDETTKIIAATAGLSDLYEMEDINTSDGIIGAQLLVSSRRTEEGFAQLTPLLRHAGTTTELTTRAISPTYFYRNRDCFVTMPNGDPLTDANVNALQAGVKRTL